MTPPAAGGSALLVELLTEELPPKALGRMGSVFAQTIAGDLAARGLAEGDATAKTFCSPRRLAVLVAGVLERAPDRTVEVKGPSVKVGLDAQGNPTQALVKWAQRQQAPIDRLTRASDGKQECFFFSALQRGDALADVMQAVIEKALAALPIPKTMQYQLADGSTTVSFVRPAHGLLVLHGESVIGATVLGLRAGRITAGHRFLGQPRIEIARATDYEARLEDDGRVIASFDTRRDRIAALLAASAKSVGGSLGDDPAVAALLEEVTALVEWPAVYVGRFDDEFLAVPQECLILTMRTNQRYFPLFDAGGRLLPQFLIVSNMAIDDPSAIIDGNQRVVRPRLADARFFFEQDRRTPLAARITRLDSVIHHAKLGTVGERITRLRAIARGLADLVPAHGGADPAHVDRAALLAKADLVTDMVGEFPELQGVMGTYYARHDGEPEAVAVAIAEHYRPRFAGDELPASPVGTLVALADKLETLAGMFGIGQAPSGDKDPFALRRHALGVIRIMIERPIEADLDRMIAAAFDAFGGRVTDARADLESFVFERLAGYLRDRGYTAQEIAAVLSQRPMRLARVPARLAAVRSFAQLPEAQALAAANKRIGNILRKSGDAAAPAVDPALLAAGAETELAAVIDRLAPDVSAAVARADYGPALAALAGSRAAVDRYFDDVMVMAEDPRVRANRLALLARLHGLMNRVADIAMLST